MLLYPILISKTASSGGWSFNTPKLDSSILKQILIKAVSTDTSFDFKLTDENSNIVYTTESKPTQTLRHELELPLKGIHTVEVFNASADEAFTGKLMLLEVK